MNMPSLTETARPIMQYVRDLEGKVLALRAERRKFQAISFVAGLALGAGAMYLLLLRYLH